MLPTKSNTEQGCSPVSSNCVVWQGPNISCINLCTGDSVSDVVYKLGMEVCALQAQLNLTDMDFACLVSSAVGTPEPEHTLQAVLELLINKVCDVDAIINAFQQNDGTINIDFPVAIPSDAMCFVTNDVNGDPVFNLAHSVFTKNIARKVCALVTLTNQHSSILTNHETRIISLENFDAVSNDLMVTPTCVLPPNIEVSVATGFEALEQQFCNLRSITGMPTALSASLTYQCQGLAQEAALNQTGTMSSLPGWKSPVSTVSDAITNMWLTMCDMRAAVKDIVINGGTGGGTNGGFNCSLVIVDFTVVTNEARTSATIYFSGLTSIADDVNDCTAQGAKITFTDSNGGKYISYVNVTSNKTNTNGVPFVLSGLNPALNYTVLLEACFIKNGSQCQKVVTKTAPVNCSIVTNVSATFV